MELTQWVSIILMVLAVVGLIVSVTRSSDNSPRVKSLKKQLDRSEKARNTLRERNADLEAKFAEKSSTALLTDMLPPEPEI